jgi:hypothetical protein
LLFFFSFSFLLACSLLAHIRLRLVPLRPSPPVFDLGSRVGSRLLCSVAVRVLPCGKSGACSVLVAHFQTYTHTHTHTHTNLMTPFALYLYLSISHSLSNSCSFVTYLCSSLSLVQVRLAEYLCKHTSININAVDKNRWTPLLTACAYSQLYVRCRAYTVFERIVCSVVLLTRYVANHHARDRSISWVGVWGVF